MQIAYLQRFFRHREVEIPLLRVTFASLAGYARVEREIGFFRCFSRRPGATMNPQWQGADMQQDKAESEKVVLCPD
jgi:hypothetical protein